MGRVAPNLSLPTETPTEGPVHIHQTPQDGLVTNDEVGPSYFDDGDRETTVRAAVRLVNALRRFGIDIGGIGVSAVCDTCTPDREAYKIELGKLRTDQADAMAAQLNAYADEFQRMHDRKRAASEKPPVTRNRATKKRKRNRT